jgi:hypothetical protein
MITFYRKRYCVCDYCGHRDRVLLGHRDNIPIETMDCPECGYGVMEITPIYKTYDATQDWDIVHLFTR